MCGLLKKKKLYTSKNLMTRTRKKKLNLFNQVYKIYKLSQDNPMSLIQIQLYKYAKKLLHFGGRRFLSSYFRIIKLAEKKMSQKPFQFLCYTSTFLYLSH